MGNRFAHDRVRQHLKRLEPHIVTASMPVEAIQTASGIAWHEDITPETDYAPFDTSLPWGGKDENRLFTFDVVIPGEMGGQRVEVVVTTGREGGWDATNPQFLAYVDGELIQGLDTNHCWFVLSHSAIKGARCKVELIGWSGMHPEKCHLNVRVRAVDLAVRKLWFDLKVPLDCALLMEPGDRSREITLNHLNAALDLLDLRVPGSEAFGKSVKDATSYLEQEFYGKACGNSGTTITALGHTHIDVAWRWTLYQTEQKTLRSFSTMLRLMAEYPKFLFMSSQPQLLEYLNNRDPKLYQEIKERVAEGRFELEGAMWLEADCNVPSGEALVRQVIHGKRYFKQEFGVDSKILWLPDVFGYSAALPQILRNCGVDTFMTTKISWNETNKMPYDTFLWQGIDGTEILTHFVTTADAPVKEGNWRTTYNGHMSAAEMLGTWQRYQHKGLTNDVLTLYGHGDGGGGTTPEMIEYALRFERGIPGMPRLRFGTAGEFFDGLHKAVDESPDLPRWVGELYLELHRGTYTAQHNNKKYNRKSEYACAGAESLALMANRLAGFDYPGNAIYRAWQEVLLLQFHDILPGSSIKEVYDDSDRQYEGVLSAMNGIRDSAMRAIAGHTAGKGVRAVVFNPGPRPQSGPVAVDLPGGWTCAMVSTLDGKTQPAQRTANGRLVFWAANVPAHGYASFQLTQAEASQEALPDYSGKIEGKRLALSFDQKGQIASIYDKLTGRELLRAGQTAGLRTYYEAPRVYDNWEISDYYARQMWPVDELLSAQVLESGPVRQVVRLEYRYLESRIRQDVICYPQDERVDFETTVNWHQSNVLLRALFPLDLHAEKAAFDVQYGNLERPTHTNTSWQEAQFEVAAHKWADLSEADYGVALLSDCKYGYSAKHGDLGISLLKSTCEPDPDMDKKDGITFTYSLYAHEGTWRDAQLYDSACGLNQPLEAVLAESEGRLPSTYAHARVDRPNILLDTVKQSYDGQYTVLRLFEAHGARTKAEIRLPAAAPCVLDTNLLEEPGEVLAQNAQSLTLSFRPYEVKTILVKY